VFFSCETFDLVESTVSNGFEDAKPTYTQGDKIQLGKNRPVLVITNIGNTIEQSFAKAKELGGVCIITKQFANGIYTLMFKNKSTPMTGDMYTLVPMKKGDRVTHAQTTSAIDLFLSGTNMTNAKKEEKDPERTMTWEDDLAPVLQDMNAKEVDVYLKNSKLAGKKGTKTQKGFVTLQVDVKDYVKAIDGASLLVEMVDKPGAFVYPDNYVTGLGEQVGVYWDDITRTIKYISFDDFFFKTDMHLRRSACFVALAGSGKTKLSEAVARKVCTKYKFDRFGAAQSIDPYGAITLSGKIKDLRS
jgi:hypothetical protein